MFERNGYYYLLYGHTCCFCRHGSNAYVSVAENPLGPWTSTGIDLNPKRDGWFESDHVAKGQNSFVIKVAKADGSNGYVFVSDLWSSADDNLKSHDHQFWHELEFDDSVDPPTISQFEWHETCDLNLALSPRDHLFS